jgi:hypothetical protein
MGTDGDGGQERPANTEQDGVQETGAHAAEPGERGPAGADPAESDLRADTDTSERAGERTDAADAHPDLYKRTDAPPPKVDGPHESPENWAGEINPGEGLDNCGDCARSAQQTWEGSPRCAAVGGPEHDSVMTQWAGASPEPASVDDINAKLAELGPGSSAIVGFDWASGGGHWSNAVNDGGAIKAVDGQKGRVGSWPPGQSTMRFSAADMHNTEAIFFDANGRVVQ